MWNTTNTNWKHRASKQACALMYSMWDTAAQSHCVLALSYKHQAHRWVNSWQFGLIPLSVCPSQAVQCSQVAQGPQICQHHEPQTDYSSVTVTERHSERGLNRNLPPNAFDPSYSLSKSDYSGQRPFHISISLNFPFPLLILYFTHAAFTQLPRLHAICLEASLPMIRSPFPRVFSVWQTFCLQPSSNCIQGYRAEEGLWRRG